MKQIIIEYLTYLRDISCQYELAKNKLATHVRVTTLIYDALIYVAMIP